ncbi:MAG: FAD-dependent monooxygenase, partial [Myxococcales bacterium]|nr:FAD-dependent monooxygenase [Myxococcales bacterium]
MRVLVAGAGPAGLAFAAQSAAAGARVTVVEREQESTLPAWTASVQTRTLDALGLGGLGAFHGHRGIRVGERAWTVPGVAERRVVGGGRLVGALRDRCTRAGVTFRWDTGFEDLPEGIERTVDLVVGADGARSAVRARWADTFAPLITHGSRHRLLVRVAGTLAPQALVGLRDTPVVAWAQGDAAVVEVGDRAYQANLARRSPIELAGRVALALDGLLDAPVVSATPMGRTATVMCRQAGQGNVLLVGDAACATWDAEG